MTRRRATATGVAVSIWLATLAIGAPPSAGQRNEDGSTRASSELQEAYPLHEPRRCCSDRPMPSAATVEPAGVEPGEGTNDLPWVIPLLLALLAALGLGLVLRLPPAPRAISAPVAPVTARRPDPAIQERVYVPRRIVRPVVIGLARPLFRYSWDLDAYVLRVIGERHGPVLEPKRARWQPRPRHIVSPVVIRLARPLFRYSRDRHAYVLRLIGERHGPVLRSRSQPPRSDAQSGL
jgi:hypothetical protein